MDGSPVRRSTSLLLAGTALWLGFAQHEPAFAQEDDRYTAARAASKAEAEDDDKALVTQSITPRESTSVAIRAESGLQPLKSALDHARNGNIAAARAARGQLSDPVARAVADWGIMRRGAEQLSFEDHVAFLKTYPSFPASAPIRKRAEGLLLENDHDASQVKAFFAGREPSTAKGKIALATALKGHDNAKAIALARDVWQESDLSKDTEETLLDTFKGAVSAQDTRIRMIRQALSGNDATALRAARRLGEGDVAVANALLAVVDKRSNAATLLRHVPQARHSDPAFQFAQIQHLRRSEHAKQAAALMLASPRDPAVLGKPEEWWIERRMIARKLLDAGDAQTAYKIAAGHTNRSGPNRVEAEFHAGWIALRFLKDAGAAERHFATALSAATTPMSKSRAHYWLGRAHDAAGKKDQARSSYQQAAHQSAHYYGQLARARIGETHLPLRRPSVSDQAGLAVPAVRAVSMLYQVGEKDLARAILADLGQHSQDEATINGAALVAMKAGDAKGVLTVGKLATNRGLPFDVHAFPTFGIPAYRPVGQPIDKAVVYAIARQESTFDPQAVSHAGARGLLQLMPATAQITARKAGLSFDAARLTRDPAYNAALGSAHLGELAADYQGSYILTFAAYNAGARRVREWIEAYGDPRDPSVDPIDWVERIPFSETRNYVQRVMENVQVYRARLGESNQLKIEGDLQRGRTALR